MTRTAPPSRARAARRFLTKPANVARPPRPSRGVIAPWRSLVPTIESVTDGGALCTTVDCAAVTTSAAPTTAGTMTIHAPRVDMRRSYRLTRPRAAHPAIDPDDAMEVI